MIDSIAEMVSHQMKHQLLDLTLGLLLVGVLFCFGNPKWFFDSMYWFISSFPNHYTNVFDFVNEPMSPVTALSVYIADVYFLSKTYWLEKQVINKAHKKFRANQTTKIVAIHGMGSAIELTMGTIAVLSMSKSSKAPYGPQGVLDGAAMFAEFGYLGTFITIIAPYQKFLVYLCVFLAICVNVPTGLMITSQVYGIKHLTVPGFSKFAYLRFLEVCRVVLLDYRLLPNLWILLQVGTIVRLLGYFVLPYSSYDGGPKGTPGRGDLFIEPTIYSFNILLSGFLTAAFVYPPHFLIGSLSLYAVAQYYMPPRISSRGRLYHEGSTDRVGDDSNGESSKTK